MSAVRCHQLQQIVPNGLARWLKVLSQPWEGDVTMVLPSAYSQIKKAVTNPTAQDLQIACLQVLSDWPNYNFAAVSKPQITLLCK